MLMMVFDNSDASILGTLMLKSQTYKHLVPLMLMMVFDSSDASILGTLMLKNQAYQH